MDDVEFTLQPASAGDETEVIAFAKKAQHKKNRANDIACDQDDDAGRTTTYQFNKPHDSDTKSDDNKVVKNIGYCC